MANAIVDLSLRPSGKLSRRRLILRLIVAGAIAAVVFGLASLPNPAAAGPSPVEIKMGDDPAVYIPAQVTVRVGQPVEWVNSGQKVHSVTLIPTDAQNPKDVMEPKGAATFDSGFMPPGGTFTHTFEVPGTYRYFCVPHEKAGMVGVIIVRR